MQSNLSVIQLLLKLQIIKSDLQLLSLYFTVVFASLLVPLIKQAIS